MSETTRLLGYARTSPGTNEDGTSLKGQSRDINDYTDKNDYELVTPKSNHTDTDKDQYTEVYCDEDISGRKTKPWSRDGFQSLIMHFRDDESIDGIVIRRQDRISRETQVRMSMAPLLEAHMGKDVELHITQEDGRISDSEVDSDDPTESMMQTFMNAFRSMMKEYEAKMAAANTKSALQQKIKRGEPVGTLCYGLTTNKKKFDENQATEWLPDDDDVDKFKQGVNVIDDFASRDTTPYDSTAASVGRECDLDVSNYTVTVRNIWDYREIFHQVTQDHRPDLTDREFGLSSD